jgi:methionine aminopeptidase
MSTLGDAADVNPVIKILPHTSQHLAVDSSDCLHDSVNHVACGARTGRLGQVIYRVWQELDYGIDICRVTKGGHIEHL